MELVFANCTAWVGIGDGRTVQIIQDEAWFAGDPVVKARPDLFNDEPSIVRGTRPVPVETAAGDAGVEQATAAPGEKRTRTKRA